MATILTVSFCFFYNAHLWCQVSRTLLQYFQRYFSFSNLPFFSCKSHDVIADNLHITKMSISAKRKKVFRKEKCHSSVFRKAFQISRKYFSCHIHFKGLYVRAYLYSAFFVTNTRFPFAFSNNS